MGEAAPVEGGPDFKDRDVPGAGVTACFPTRLYTGSTWALHAALGALHTAEEADRAALGEKSGALVLWALAVTPLLGQAFSAVQLAEAAFHPEEIRQLTEAEAGAALKIGVRAGLLKSVAPKDDERAGYAVTRPDLREHLMALRRWTSDLPDIEPIYNEHLADQGGASAPPHQPQA